HLYLTFTAAPAGLILHYIACPCVAAPHPQTVPSYLSLSTTPAAKSTAQHPTLTRTIQPTITKESGTLTEGAAHLIKIKVQISEQ
ncbi:MAG: hypothetical protein IJ684_04980, partial [Bacteroidales bacterium]|nr:hypothetical protein [Bacteroidales bacterium]